MHKSNISHSFLQLCFKFMSVESYEPTDLCWIAQNEKKSADRWCNRILAGTNLLSQSCVDCANIRIQAISEQHSFLALAIFRWCLLICLYGWNHLRFRDLQWFAEDELGLLSRRAGCHSECRQHWIVHEFARRNATWSLWTSLCHLPRRLLYIHWVSVYMARCGRIRTCRHFIR